MLDCAPVSEKETLKEVSTAAISSAWMAEGSGRINFRG